MTPDAENILSLIQPRFGSADSARIWFEEVAIPGFSGQTARQLVLAGLVAEVLDYIAAVDVGIYANTLASPTSFAACGQSACTR